MIKASIETTEIVTTIASIDAGTMLATKNSLGITFDTPLLPVMASLIGDVAVIFTVGIMIVYVVIRFKKGQLSGTTTPVSRSNTDVERIQA